LGLPLPCNDQEFAKHYRVTRILLGITKLKKKIEKIEMRHFFKEYNLQPKIGQMGWAHDFNVLDRTIKTNQNTTGKLEGA